MALGRCCTIPLVVIAAATVLVLVGAGTEGGKGKAALMVAADIGGGKELLDISVLFVSDDKGFIDKAVFAGLLFDDPFDFFETSVSMIPSFETDDDEEDDDGTIVCPLVPDICPVAISSMEPLLLLVVNCDGARLTNENASILPLIMVKLPTSLLVMNEVNSTRLGKSRYFMDHENLLSLTV